MLISNTVIPQLNNLHLKAIRCKLFCVTNSEMNCTFIMYVWCGNVQLHHRQSAAGQVAVIFTRSTGRSSITRARADSGLRQTVSAATSSTSTSTMKIAAASQRWPTWDTSSFGSVRQTVAPQSCLVTIRLLLTLSRFWWVVATSHLNRYQLKYTCCFELRAIHCLLFASPTIFLIAWTITEVR